MSTSEPTVDLHSLRADYRRDELLEAEVATDPFAQFAAWFAEAQKSDIREPNAMTIATVSADGQPSARMVLLKDVSAGGLTFFTNYRSQKGAELEANTRAALLFFWPPLERQVRIEGRVQRVSEAESSAYFAERPRASQLGAWASQQSSVLPDRGTLDAAYAAREHEFAQNVPRPPFWGGFRVIPNRFEFWQGRTSRLHDRLVYTPSVEGWTLARLAP